MVHRKRLGLTQDSLAEQLGITAQAVSKWENDQSCPDITMLPKLAGIFEISIDELLGLPRKAERKEENVLGHSEAPMKNPCRVEGIWIAFWLLLTGGVLLAAELFPMYLFRTSLWQTVFLTGLTVFGLSGLYPRLRIFRLGCGLLGGYYLYCLLFQPVIQLNQELLLPLLLLFFGLGLLVEAIRGKQLPMGHMDWKDISNHFFDCNGNGFSCKTIFGEARRVIPLKQLDRGTAEVIFGELSVDICNCATVGENACIWLKCEFGSLTLYVPHGWQLQCVNKTAFGMVREYGSPDADPEQLLRVECSVSFGEISIKYI